MFAMRHYVSRNTDGTVHVTNAVGGMIGQHHVHTEESFAAWSPAGSVEKLEGVNDCNCGLKAGDAKEGQR